MTLFSLYFPSRPGEEDEYPPENILKQWLKQYYFPFSHCFLHFCKIICCQFSLASPIRFRCSCCLLNAVASKLLPSLVSLTTIYLFPVSFPSLNHFLRVSSVSFPSLQTGEGGGSFLWVQGMSVGMYLNSVNSRRNWIVVCEVPELNWCEAVCHVRVSQRAVLLNFELEMSAVVTRETSKITLAMSLLKYCIRSWGNGTEWAGRDWLGKCHCVRLKDALPTNKIKF